LSYDQYISRESRKLRVQRTPGTGLSASDIVTGARKYAEVFSAPRVALDSKKTHLTMFQTAAEGMEILHRRPNGNLSEPRSMRIFLEQPVYENRNCKSATSSSNSHDSKEPR
jgi:hypothetical protein